MTALATAAAAAEPFRFESVASLQDMQALARHDFPLGTPRDQVRAAFVQQGGATLKLHAKRAETEKYLYDIDLCGYYVWRWNISADYDAKGGLKQLYVNATPMLANAPPPPLPAKGPFYMLSRPRPQAAKGESTLKAIINGDQMMLTAIGPTRPDPLNMGRAINYTGEVWRSIFDADDADHIAPYAGDCAKVDAEMKKQIEAAKAAPNGAPSH
ncbi:hypothetical protein [Phenylobacterium sp.]|uniref:hypothetical protein n=1 Tax=Phenylobacterium sp. TaxID=1871053 RepID=UPI002BC1385D|nr:hypothetical protein [Phenylobacterium sp.]HLZ76825.1 hypothetical protein [Phenylobacterium sp.]